MIVSEVVDTFVGGNHVTCDQTRDINLGTYGSEDYVLSTGQKFKAELLSNNTLRIFDGVAVYGGVRDVVAVNSYHDVTIENGTQGMNRNDIAVRYFSINEKTRVGSAIFKMIKGTPTNGEALDPEIEVTDLRAGALEHSMLFYRVRLEGLNVVAVEPMFNVLTSMAEQQAKLDELDSKIIEKDYSLEDIPIATFFNVTDFFCRKIGKQVLFNVSVNLQQGNILNTNTMYQLLGASVLPEELRPITNMYLDMWGCGSSYESASKCACIVAPTGKISYNVPETKTYYKISGTWVTEW